MKKDNPGPWYAKPIRGIGMNMWAPEWYHSSIKYFDAEKLSEAVHASKATVGFTFQGFTQDVYGVYYFPSEYGPRHRNLGDRDHMAEYVEAMHKRNLKVFGYIFYPDKKVWEKNTDWRQKSADGNDIVPKRWGMLCPNSPYRDFFIARMQEITERYEIDGFLLDTVFFSPSPMGCYCDYCKRKYLERYGKALPVTGAGYSVDMRQFLRWRDRNLVEFHADVRKSIKKIRSTCVYTHNAFAFKGIQILNGEWRIVGSGAEEDLELTLQNDDIVTSIISWQRSLASIWETGALTKVLRGLSQKQVWLQFGHFPYHRDYQTLPLHELKLATYSVITSGGNPFFIGNLYPDGKLEEISLERMGEVYTDVEKKAEYLEYDEELKYAAVYFSKESQDFYDMVYPGKLHYLLGVKGCMKALVEAKIPFQVIGEKNLTAQKLQQYKVLIIPDAVIMQDGQIAAIKKFVNSGGTLISTGKTSLIDIDGSSRDNFGLAEVFHTNYVNAINYSVSFIIPTEHAICKNIDPREQIPHRGYQVKTETQEGAEVVAHIALPNTEIVHGVRLIAFDEADVSAETITDHPAAVFSRHGKGSCVYFAGNPTGGYGSYGYPSLRKLLINAIDYCQPDSRLVTVNGPLNLEIGCFKQGNKVLIHLLNYTTNNLTIFTAEGGPQSEEGIPCTDIAVTYRPNGATVKRIYLASTEKDLDFSTDGDRISFVVPKVDVHEIVVAET